MITRSRLIALTGVLTIFSLMVIYSCKKDKDEPVSTPDLPPSESILMDFSAFSNPNDTLDLKKASELLNGFLYTNWGHSYSTVVFWNSLATASLAIPTACYLKILENNPVYKGDNTWEWTASYTGINATYDAKLVCKRISNVEFLAEMYISKSGMLQFTDFKWFEGIIRYDRTHAIWTVYESPDNPEDQLFDIEWNKNWENNTGDIKYLYVKTGLDITGSFIDYKVTSDPILDASYTVSFAGDSTYIEWNRALHNGHVKDYQHFGDYEWHCWNDLLQNTDCPQ